MKLNPKKIWQGLDKKKAKKLLPFAIALTIVVFAATGVFGYKYYQDSHKPTDKGTGQSEVKGEVKKTGTVETPKTEEVKAETPQATTPTETTPYDTTYKPASGVNTQAPAAPSTPTVDANAAYAAEMKQFCLGLMQTGYNKYQPQVVAEENSYQNQIISIRNAAMDPNNPAYSGMSIAQRTALMNQSLAGAKQQHDMMEMLLIAGRDLVPTGCEKWL
ncbi:MAG: hypothetical protein WCP14_04395 [bacterium]